MGSAALIGLLLACGGGPSSAPGPHIPRVDPPPESGLVWLTDAAGQHRTVWVSLDGTPLTSQPIEGPLWAWEGTLWQWLEEPVEVPLYEASEPGAQPSPSGAHAEAHRGVLRELVEDQRIEIVAPPAGGALRSIDQQIALVGSVGPYLFLNEITYVDSFGAHGASESRATVWDLRTAARAEVLTEREHRAFEEAPREQARQRLVDEGREAGVGPDLALERVELVALRPRWTEAGIELALRFATEACYACGDGAWSDYTRSVEVAAPTTPEQLAAHATVPPWARAVLASAPGHRLSGFTRVSEQGPARVLDALHR